MKHYYRILDAVLQAAILTAWLITVLLNHHSAIIFYYVTSIWFFISLTIHASISSEKYKEKYVKPLVIICCALGIGAICLVCPSLMYIALYFEAAVAPLFAVVLPVAAVFYTGICIAEILYLHKRPMSYLK